MIAATAVLLSSLLAFTLQGVGASNYPNPTPVLMGATSSFGVVAASTITNSGATTVNGNLALYSGSEVVGFPIGIVTGTQYIADSTALKIQGDLTIAIGDANSRPMDQSVAGDLGGLVLTPGVYKSTSGLGITGILYLDAKNDPDAAWIFQIASFLSVESGASVVMLNPYTGDFNASLSNSTDYMSNSTGINVWWNCGSSASLDTTSLLLGTVMAMEGITLASGAVVKGAVMSSTASVTFLTNEVFAYDETSTAGLDDDIMYNTTTVVPTTEPSTEPTAMPSFEPTVLPSFRPTAAPSFSPSATPTVEPTAVPSFGPTAAPSLSPSATPTVEPTAVPSFGPTAAPSLSPIATPTVTPTAAPSAIPTATPTAPPTAVPTSAPNNVAPSVTRQPSFRPSESPTRAPTVESTVAKISMGSLTSFAVIAATTITSTGETVVTGNIALYPGVSVVGFPVGIITGTQYIGGSTATSVHNDLTAAILDAGSRASNATVSGDLGGLTLAPGVYTSATTLAITGTLYLDAQNDPEAYWLFQIGSSFSVSTSSDVVMLNTADNSTEKNVAWNVGTSATIAADATLLGTVLAYSSVSVGSGSTTGPLFASNGAVTLILNSVTAYDPSAKVDTSGSAASALHATGSNSAKALLMSLACFGATFFLVVVV